MVNDVERRTIWKIQDCQDLLSKRINEDFVNEAIRISRENILKEVKLKKNKILRFLTKMMVERIKLKNWHRNLI